jgi:2,3-bisphosphoglycerate-dependent phosphoglycerate mutase
MPERYEQRPFAVPPDAVELLLVRHGASMGAPEGEAPELLEGHSNPPLAPSGHEQALRVADRLAALPLCALYVTPLQRTHQTAAPLAERLGLVPTEIADLREVFLGEWEGGEFRRRAIDGSNRYRQVMAQERWDLIPGAESGQAFADRVRRGIEAIVADAGPGAPVAAFVHGGVIGEACRQATASRPFAFLFADNCSITRLVVLGDGRWLLRTFNDVTHL